MKLLGLINKDYNQKELNNIIKKLYDTNFFKKISLTVNGQTLVLTIEENKIIQNVSLLLLGFYSTGKVR